VQEKHKQIDNPIKTGCSARKTKENIGKYHGKKILQSMVVPKKLFFFF